MCAVRLSSSVGAGTVPGAGPSSAAASSVSRAPDSALSPRLHAGWALGSFATSILVNSTGLLGLRFMTDELGIGAALAASLLVLSKIYDGITDPIMGVVSDRTRSRWGRRRPYLLAGAFLCATAMYAMFNVPDMGSPRALATYMVCALLLYATAYTVFRIPYLSLGADLTRSFADRSRLMTFNVYGSSLGSLFATTAAPFLLAFAGGGREAHGLMASILAALILVSGLACFRLTAGAPDIEPAPARAYTLREKLDALAQNRPFVLLITTKILLFVGLGVHSTGIAFFTKHALGLSDYSLGTLFMLQTLATVVSQPLWMRIANAFGRRNCLLIAVGCDVLVMSAFWLVPADGADVWLVALGPLKGLVGGGIFLSMQCMLPDTMNYDARRFGMHREGLFAGIFVMVEKFTQAIAAAVFGAVIGTMGYVAAAGAGTAQPAEAILGIRIAVSVVPAGILLLAMAVLTNYRLPRDWIEDTGRSDTSTPDACNHKGGPR
jgi:sugar (glycoside-pentoside-hexuronide) transporter